MVSVEIKGSRDTSTGEGYARWRDLTASTVTYVEVKSPQTDEKLIKRKRVDNEEELRRQIEKL